MGWQFGWLYLLWFWAEADLRLILPVNESSA